MIYFHSEVQELFTSRYTIELRMNDFTRLDVNDPVCKSTRHRPRVRRGVMGSFFLRQDSKKSSHNRVISFDIELRYHTTHRQPTVIEMRCSNQHVVDFVEGSSLSAKWKCSICAGRTARAPGAKLGGSDWRPL